MYSYKLNSPEYIYNFSHLQLTCSKFTHYETQVEYIYINGSEVPCFHKTNVYT